MRIRTGFTLIELIVVIAVIGLLIGILAPALAGAMTTARRAKCMSNLKGFGPALQMCMDSGNQGILPAAPGYSGRYHNYIGYTRFFVLLQDYMDAPLPPQTDERGFRDGHAPFLCPSDPASPNDPDGSGGIITRPLAREHGFSYHYQAGLHMAPVWDPNAVDPQQARRITFWYEMFPTTLAVMRDAGAYHPQSPDHYVKSNNLYFDGSVDWLRNHPEWPGSLGTSGGGGGLRAAVAAGIAAD